MKKLCIALLVFPFMNIAKGQNETVVDTAYSSSSEIFDEYQAPMVAKRISSKEDFNVLISNEHIAGYTNYYLFNNLKGFVDTSLNNTFKQVSDSVYEIQINNPSKEVLLVDNNVNPAKYTIGTIVTKPEGGLNSAEIMGRGYETINYKINASIVRYKVINFNPFISGIAYELRDNKTQKLIRRFVFHYSFPKPILIMATSNDTIIKEKKRNPSLAFGIVSEGLWKNEIHRSFDKNHNSILIVFEHFARRLRSENDNLLYRLDDEINWSYTALSLNPSILVENLSVGTHTLYVKYPSFTDNILEYHFTIAPN